MKLDKMILKNYRCFNDICLELHPTLTVLVAENGQGKSTLLDAIRTGLWPFINSFDLAKTVYSDTSNNSLTIDDVRTIKMVDGSMARQLPASIQMFGEYTGQAHFWERFRESETKGTKTKDDDGVKKLKIFARKLQDQIRLPIEKGTSLPVFGYYGTGRLWAQKRLMETSNNETDDTQETDFYIRTFAYLNCMDPASSYKHFKEWFIWAFQSYRESQIKQVEEGVSEKLTTPELDRIRVVQNVIDIFLKESTGWHTLEYSVSQEKSLILHNDQQGIMKVDQLSDGVRSILAMVGDIAYRCIKLNPHLGREAAQKSTGVVLIDEVDMHLHPRWQQLVLSELQVAFPNIQFIVTTHSPQVLSTVKRENIRVLAVNNKGELFVESPLAMSYGEESQNVLQAIMAVDPQPPIPERKMLKELTQLVESGVYNSPKAQTLYAELQNKLSSNHPQLQRIERSIRRQEALKK